MTDKNYLKTLKELKKELHRRYGKDMCKELDFGCPDCKIRVLIAHLNDLQSHIEWMIDKNS